MIPRQTALAAMRLNHGYAVRLGKRAQCLPSLAVKDATTGNNERFFGSFKQMGGFFQLSRISRWSAKTDQVWLQKINRTIECMGLHILRQSQAHGATIGRIGHH